jgi:hypothetical protein
MAIFSDPPSAKLPSSNPGDRQNSRAGDRRRDLTYSMDVLIPGVYLWLGPVTVRLGGSIAEDNYPGVVHSWAGFAIVFPGYRIYSTYQGSYDP